MVKGWVKLASIMPLRRQNQLMLFGGIMSNFLPFWVGKSWLILVHSDHCPTYRNGLNWVGCLAPEGDATAEGCESGFLLPRGRGRVSTATLSSGMAWGGQLLSLCGWLPGLAQPSPITITRFWSRTEIFSVSLCNQGSLQLSFLL